MFEYRLYCLDKSGRIKQRHELTAPDDAAAIEAAREIEPAAAVELWSGPRKVAELPPAGEPASVPG